LIFSGHLPEVGLVTACINHGQMLANQRAFAKRNPWFSWRFFQLKP
jgi:hypothetical protein